MVRSIRTALPILIGALAPMTIAAQQINQPELTVRALQQQGWKITATGTRNETRPGLPPYEHLKRVVSITTYELARDNQTIKCEIVYDSQRDTIEEQCADPGP